MELKKKILFVITKSNFGGAQRYVFDLATNLPKESYDVVVAFGGDGLLKTKLENADVRTRHIASFDRDINLNKEVRAFRELSQIIREEKPDIMHLNSSKAGGTGALAARLAGVPRIIFTAHGWPFFENRNIIWRAAIWFLSWITTLLSHAVIVVSEHDMKRARMFGLSHKLHHIYTALPPIAFLSRNDARAQLYPSDIITAHQNETWLVTIAEHTANKNLLMGIRAVEEHNATHASKIFYTLIGDGELRKEIQTYIDVYNLSKYIQCVGYKENASVLLPAFDLFLLPSTKEGFPYTLLEAGLAGVPCIASNVGGIPELIKDCETGLLIDPYDVQSITNVLGHAIKNSETTTQYATRLQETIRTNFDIKKMLKQTTKLYSSN